MSSTYIELNNQGVRLLMSDGEKEKAAKLFQKAFDMLKGTIIDAETARCEAADSALTEMTALDDDETIPEGIQGKRRTRAAEVSSLVCDETDDEDEKNKNYDHEKSKGRAVKRRSMIHEEDCAPCQKDENSQPQEKSPWKRPRIDTATPGQKTDENQVETNFDGTLCRPLWLEPAHEKCAGALAPFASSILYNYAYTLHRMGTERTQGRGSRSASSRGRYLRRQAMNVYCKVLRLCGKRRCPVVQWMCCHNLQRLICMELAQVTDNGTASKLEQRFQYLEAHKIAILRALFSTSRGGGGGCIDHLFLSVLSMLALGRNERPVSLAAAA